MEDRAQARVVWMEDGKLVDKRTAKRPFQPSERVKAKVQRILDAEARRRLDQQLDPDAA
jgi:hypothetical protein